MRALAAIALAGILSSACFADVVYLRNGKSYEGTTQRIGDKVRIKMALGTIDVPAADVVYVEKRAVTTRPKQPAGEPKASPGSSPAQDSTRDVGRLALTVDLANIVMPESAGFILMRRPDGGAFSQVQQYRNMAHERKRHIGSKWVSPEEIIRRRGVYEKYAKEAEEYDRKAASVYGSTARAVAERRKNEQLALARYRMAARAWPDPLMRDFLLAVVELNAGRHAQAEAFFRSCCQDAPRVAAFHQGRGMALVKLKRPLEAVAEFTLAVQLSNSKRGEIVQNLQDAMKDVVGARTDEPDYVAARDLLKDLGLDKPAAAGSTVSTPVYSSTYTQWLLPAGKKTSRNSAPPALNFDRLYFKQAVGLPVGEHALLVDASILEGACQIFVRIDDTTVVPGTSQRMNALRPDASPLALVQISKYVLEPVPTITGEEQRRTYSYNPKPTTQPAKAKITKGMMGRAYALSVMEEMGSQIRTVDVAVKSYDPNGVLEISGELAPGESAAPVLTEDGTLLCYLAGRTDIRADGGGPAKAIPLSAIVKQIRAGRRSTGTYVYGGAKNVTTQPAPGKVFIVYATFAEAFKEDK